MEWGRERVAMRVGLVLTGFSGKGDVMNEGKRPGGLTALAVLNFIFAAFSLLGMVGMVALFAKMGMAANDQMDEQTKALFEALQEMGMGILVIGFVLSALSGVLLLVSGIGYLKQKRIMGRVVGSIYGIISIVSSVVTGLLFDPAAGGGFNIGTIIGLVYPVLTVILLNTTFKDDLTN